MSGVLRTWDYHAEIEPDQERLDALGSEGWELIAVVQRHRVRYVFRRPAQSFVERVTLEQRARYYESLGLDPGSAQ